MLNYGVSPLRSKQSAGWLAGWLAYKAGPDRYIRLASYLFADTRFRKLLHAALVSRHSRELTCSGSTGTRASSVQCARFKKEELQEEIHPVPMQ